MTVCRAIWRMMVGTGGLAEWRVHVCATGSVDRMDAGSAGRPAGSDREHHPVSGLVRTRCAAERRLLRPAADDSTPVRGLVCALWSPGGSGRDLLRPDARSGSDGHRLQLDSSGPDKGFFPCKRNLDRPARHSQGS